MTPKEKILLQLQDVADELRDTNNWSHIERLSDYIEDIKDELENL